MAHSYEGLSIIGTFNYIFKIKIKSGHVLIEDNLLF